MSAPSAFTFDDDMCQSWRPSTKLHRIFLNYWFFSKQSLLYRNDDNCSKRCLKSFFSIQEFWVSFQKADARTLLAQVLPKEGKLKWSVLKLVCYRH
jgi:hypothetical protein